MKETFKNCTQETIYLLLLYVILVKAAELLIFVIPDVPLTFWLMLNHLVIVTAARFRNNFYCHYWR